MKNWSKLIVSILVCELAGVIGAAFTIRAISTWYATLQKPSFSPPNWIFGPVWIVLYALMGVSFYLIWKQNTKKQDIRVAKLWFFAQLAINVLWSPVFFGLRSPTLGLVTISVLWLLIVKTIRAFYPLSKSASYLFFPYLLWVSFATLLNIAIAAMN